MYSLLKISLFVKYSCITRLFRISFFIFPSFKSSFKQSVFCSKVYKLIFTRILSVCTRIWVYHRRKQAIRIYATLQTWRYKQKHRYVIKGFTFFIVYHGSRDYKCASHHGWLSTCSQASLWRSPTATPGFSSIEFQARKPVVCRLLIEVTLHK